MRSFVASVSWSGFASYILGPVVRPAIGRCLWAFVMLLLAGTACVEAGPSVPLTEGDVESIERESAESGVGAIKAELAGRSFRQFEPHIEGDPRKGVVLDFSGRFSLWAQCSEGGHAISEWEIVADDYRVEGEGPRSVATLYPVAPRTWQQLPSECGDCVDAKGVSVSVKNIMGADRTVFRVNDPGGVPREPFPVFTTWTEFREDEWANQAVVCGISFDT